MLAAQAAAVVHPLHAVLPGGGGQGGQGAGGQSTETVTRGGVYFGTGPKLPKIVGVYRGQVLLHSRLCLLVHKAKMSQIEIKKSTFKSNSVSGADATMAMLVWHALCAQP